MSQYYYRIFGAKFGPVTLEMLQHEIASGQLSSTHEVQCGDETGWTTVADFVAQKFADRSPAPPSPQSMLTWDGGHDDVEAIENAPIASPVRTAGIRTIDQWFCRGPRVGNGPFTFDDLVSHARRGELVAEDEVSLSEHGPWTSVGSIERLMSEMVYQLPENMNPTLSPATVAIVVESSTASAVTQVESSNSNPATHVDFEMPAPLSVEQRPEPKAVETTSQWYARMGKVERGPMEFQKLVDLAAGGHIVSSDRVRQVGQSEWKIAREIPGLFSSYTSSTQIDIPTSLATPRPSLAPLFELTQTRNSPKTSRIELVMPAADQSTAPSTSPEFSYSLEAAHSRASEPRMMSSSSEIRTQFRNVTFDDQPESHQSPPESGAPLESHQTLQSVVQPIRRPPPQVNGESKHKLRRGHYEEPRILDRRNVIVASSIGVICLVAYIVICMRPVTLEQFHAPFMESMSIYSILDEKWAQRPSIELWAMTRKEVVHKLESLKMKIRRVNLRHEVREYLDVADDCMIRAAKSDPSEDVTLRLEQARELLELSQKLLWPDPETKEKG